MPMPFPPPVTIATRPSSLPMRGSVPEGATRRPSSQLLAVAAREKWKFWGHPRPRKEGATLLDLLLVYRNSGEHPYWFTGAGGALVDLRSSVGFTGARVR